MPIEKLETESKPQFKVLGFLHKDNKKKTEKRIKTRFFLTRFDFYRF